MFKAPTIKDSIMKFTQRLRDNFATAKATQKLTRNPHIGETGESNESLQKKMTRNIEVVRITQDTGYKHVKNTLEAIEGDAYYNLRVPHAVRDVKESMEFFIGFQAGRLAVVDDIRVMEQTALMELEKQKLKEKEEYERSQRTKSTS